MVTYFQLQGTPVLGGSRAGAVSDVVKRGKSERPQAECEGEGQSVKGFPLVIYEYVSR